MSEKKLWAVEVCSSSAWTGIEAETEDDAIELAKTMLLSTSKGEIDVVYCYRVDGGGHKITKEELK